MQRIIPHKTTIFIQHTMRAGILVRIAYFEDIYMWKAHALCHKFDRMRGLELLGLRIQKNLI